MAIICTSCPAAVLALCRLHVNAAPTVETLLRRPWTLSAERWFRSKVSVGEVHCVFLQPDCARWGPMWRADGGGLPHARIPMERVADWLTLSVVHHLKRVWLVNLVLEIEAACALPPDAES